MRLTYSLLVFTVLSCVAPRGLAQAFPVLISTPSLSRISLAVQDPFQAVKPVGPALQRPLAFTPQSAYAAPNTPINLGVAKAGTEIVRLTWVNTAANESSFEIQREVRSGGGWGNTTTLTTSANVTSYTDMPGSGSFRYRLRAVNAYGASAWTSWGSSPKL